MSAPRAGGVVLVVWARQLAIASMVVPRCVVNSADTLNSPPEADSSTPFSDAAEALAISTVLNGPSINTRARVSGNSPAHSLGLSNPASTR